MMWLFILISLITVFEAKGQLNNTQTGGITNGVGSQNAQPVLNNADAIKVAETLVNTANQLLSILKRGSGGSTAPPAEKDVYYGAPAALCPSGQPQAQCDTDPCMAWDCANIAGVQCERTCDSCNPVFTTRGRDVTAICELRRVQRPIQMMPAPILPFDTFASEGLHPLERMILRGTFPAK
uniref:Uncharacterized protein LOC111114819 isoform X3 n=1 Tax=Crassostrea virginica TaxID=6565 RepID=A0A8B8C040_CRAVI|nr:uncharacterized protein LOC111114819 isoform X3 [Crassostrea virginica]